MTVRVDVHLTPDDLHGALTNDVRRGLTASPKDVPPKWFYDDRGSQLFDEITRLDEYYPTRAERSILDRTRGRDRGGQRCGHAHRAGIGNIGEDAAAARRARADGAAASLRAVRRQRDDTARRRARDRR